MKTKRVYVTALNNGDFFSVGVYDYLFVGKTVFEGTEGYVGCNQPNGDFKVFPCTQIVEVPRPKPQRTDFWYKKKFLELVKGNVDHNKVDEDFKRVSDKIFYGITIGRYGMYQTNYRGFVISIDLKYYDGVTVMLINTQTGKSVACRHINPYRVTADNTQAILFDLYKKYMNQ